jgi:hypothetical protein
MKLRIYFTAFHWDNYQGGSGVYQSHRLTVEFGGDHQKVWEHIHDEVKKYLASNRAFDQSTYSKAQGEYTIEKVELL